MRIAVTHPYCWPYIRRGNERNIEELARYMTGRGHEVFTISTKPGAAAVEETDYGRRILHRALAGPVMKALRIEETHIFFWRSLRTLSSLRADVVHSWYFYDALAASCVASRAGHRTILQINGVPVPGVSCYRWYPPEGWLQREAARRADATNACSVFIRNWAEEQYGVVPHVIPPPVNMERYELGSGPCDGRPTFLSVADFDIPRKGVRVLLRAFHLVKSHVPDAILRLAGRLSPDVRAEVLRDLPASTCGHIEFLGVQDSAQVARLYRESSVMVLASMWEPSGTVVIEALSAGTPVVATCHAGIPEFVDERVAVLFDPKTEAQQTENAGGLADAMIEGLRLSQQDGIRARCRAHVRRFSWEVLGPKLESLYRGDARPSEDRIVRPGERDAYSEQRIVP